MCFWNDIDTFFLRYDFLLLDTFFHFLFCDGLFLYRFQRIELRIVLGCFSFFVYSQGHGMRSEWECPCLRILPVHLRSIREFPRIGIGSSISCECEIYLTTLLRGIADIGMFSSSLCLPLSIYLWR